jgi:hypothetical protein
VLPGLSWLPRVVRLCCLLTLLGPVMLFQLIDFVPRFLLPLLLAAEIYSWSMIFNWVYLRLKMKTLMWMPWRGSHVLSAAMLVVSDIHRCRYWSIFPPFIPLCWLG